MAMNWGAFAGALSQTALSTYERLGEEEMREMQRKKLKQEQADEDAFRAAMRDAPVNKGTGGIDISDAVSQGLQNFTPEQTQYLQAELAKMPPEQAQAALRAYGASEYGSGALPLKDMGVYRTQDGKMQVTSDFKPMGQSERMGYVLQRMQDSGNITGAQRALQFKSLFRDSEQQDQFDKFTDNLRDVQTFVAKGDADGFVERLKKDGLDVRLQKGKDGAVALQYFEKGKLVQSFPSLAEAGAALSEQLTTQMVAQNPSLFKDIAGLTAYQAQRYKLKQGDKELDIKERQLASEDNYRRGALANQNKASFTPYGEDASGRPVFANNRGPGFVYGDGSAVPDSTKVRSTSAIVAGTRTDGTSMAARADDLAAALIGAGTVNPRTNKPFGNVEEARVHAYQMLLKDPGKNALTESEKIAYPKFLDAVKELPPGSGTQQVLSLAKQFGLRPEVIGLPDATPTVQRIQGADPSKFEQGVLNGGKPAAPKSAIPAKPAAPAYTPPPDSPAGRSQQIQKDAKQRAEQAKIDRAEASKRADAEVAKVLPSMSMEEAAALQDSPTFSLLSPGMKAAVQRKVLGR